MASPSYAFIPMVIGVILLGVGIFLFIRANKDKKSKTLPIILLVAGGVMLLIGIGLWLYLRQGNQTVKKLLKTELNRKTLPQ
jgi:uncharacterized membrane protein